MSRITSIFIIILFLPCACFPVFCESLSFSYLMELGKKSYRRGLKDDALHYFKLAAIVQPYNPKPQEYISAIQGTDKKPFSSPEVIPPKVLQKKISASPQLLQNKLKTKPKKKISILSDKPAKEKKSVQAVEKQIQKPSTAKKLMLKSKQPSEKNKPKYTISLDQKFKDSFPLTVQLYFGNFFIIEGKNITRFMAVSPDIVSVKKSGSSRLIVTAEKFGSTFFHVWDSGERWTFDVKISPALLVSEKENAWEQADGFDFWYNSDWDSYYKGRRLGTMKRKTLLFNQDGGLRGSTPYGQFDASVSWSKSNQLEEISGYTVGLKDGHVGDFNDFDLRGFDFSKSFSDLTFPGSTLRGFSFESPAFNHLVDYSVIYGQEKKYFQSPLFPGVVPRENTYVEGLRIGLFPEKQNKVYFNYAHGYGQDREDFLKDKVFSVQTEHNLKNALITSEFASDEDAVAARLSSQLRLPKLNLKMSLRDVDKKFVNIVSRPPSAGEMGSLFEANWFPRDYFSLYSSLDVYRNRLLFNPSNYDALNYDWNSYFNITLPHRANINTSIYYSNTPGLLSPHRNLTAQTVYNKVFDLDFFGKHSISSFLGYNYQKSINPSSQTSDYQRYGLLSGVRFSLTPDVSFYTNYNYSWLDELSTDLHDTPSVRETGIDFYRAISPKVSSNIRVYWRDEEKSNSLHSFLSGEDSLEGNINLTYNPTRDSQLFLDSRVRNVWAENQDTEKFIEADIRLGVRLLWDSFFRWAPSTKIEGYVFKDSNGDGKKGEKEEPVPGVKIIAGPKTIETDDKGKSSTSVRAKKITASLDTSTIPRGYVPTTLTAVEVDTSRGGEKEIYFGVSSQTGVYGIVFYDENGNDSFDKGERSLAKVKLRLDGERTLTTNANGVYFFGGINSGMHTLTLDVNSLPLEYIPTTPIKLEIKALEGITSIHHFPLRKK